MSTARYNWTAAFVAFCNNHPMTEISEAFGIPMEKLQERATADRWAGLKAEMPLAASTSLALTPSSAGPVGVADPFAQGRGGITSSLAPVGLPVALKAKLDTLINNRKLNFDQAVKLREYYEKLLCKLASGELKMEQLFHNKGTVVRTTRDISPADLVNIVTAGRLIHDLTYRALGDGQAQEKAGQDAPVGQQAAPQIIINLPSAIAQPREQRSLLDAAKAAGAQIVEVKAIDVQTMLAKPDEPPAQG